MKKMIKYIILAGLVSCVAPATILLREDMLLDNTKQVMLYMIPVIVIVSILIGLVINKRKKILVLMPVLACLFAAIGLYATGTLLDYYNQYTVGKNDYEQYVSSYFKWIDDEDEDLPIEVNLFNYTKYYKEAMKSNIYVGMKYLQERKTNKTNVLEFMNEVRKNKFYYQYLNSIEYVDVMASDINLWTIRETMKQDTLYNEIKSSIYNILLFTLLCFISYIFAAIFSKYYEDKEKEDVKKNNINQDLDWMR